MRKLLDEKLARFEELERLMDDQEVLADSSRFAAVAREHGSLTKLCGKYRRFKQLNAEIEEAKEMLEGADAEMRELAEMELPGLREERETYWNELLDLLRACAERMGCTPAQIALAWALAQDVSVVVGGARNKSQLAQNLATTTLEFPQEMLEELSVAARTLEQTIPRQQDNIFGHAW